MKLSSQHYAPAALPRERTPYTLNRRLGEQSRPGHFGEHENDDWKYYSIVTALKFRDFPVVHVTFYDQNIVHDGIWAI